MNEEVWSPQYILARYTENGTIKTAFVVIPDEPRSDEELMSWLVSVRLVGYEVLGFRIVQPPHNQKETWNY